MNIEFTSKEYQVLLDMLSIADWVMNAFVEDEAEHSKEHEALKRKLFSFYKEMGEERRVEFAPEFDDYFETREYERYIQETFLLPYEDNLFEDKKAE